MPIQSQFGIGGLGGGNSTLGLMRSLQQVRDYTKASQQQYKSGREGAWVGLGGSLLKLIPGVGNILGGIVQGGYNAHLLGKGVGGGPVGTAAPPQQTPAMTGTTDALAFLASLQAAKSARSREEKLTKLNLILGIGSAAALGAGAAGEYLSKSGKDVAVEAPKVGASSSLGGANAGPGGYFPSARI